MLVDRRAFLATLLAATPGLCLGRKPLGGTLRLSLPWGIERLDPHDLDDPIAALFAPAISDPLFGLDASGRPYPALARGLPEAIPGGARIRLRRGLVTARGRALSSADVRASLERSRRRGGAALTFDLTDVRRVPSDPLALDFPGAELGTLAARLASPLTAILPGDYSPLEPDGTGAFRAFLAAGRLVLKRNEAATRGPAFLDAIEVDTVRDLADGLRAFESGTTSVGWLGSGLHRPRAGAVSFRGMAYGWVILRTGQARSGWNAPGVAAKLVDGIPADRLSHLGLDDARAAGASVAWGAGPAEILVRSDAPQLVMVAKTVAEVLGDARSPLSVAQVSRNELAQRRARRDYALMIDFVRPLGPKGPLTQLALLAAENPELARRPPHTDTFEPRSLTRGTSFGVIGELWARGAHEAPLSSLEGWQLADVWRLPEPA
jgi:peptide/nickel transport system substrate-binding protein